MDKNRFNKMVRPLLIEIPIGTQGIAFDVVELNAWVDHYKRCNGRPVSKNMRRQSWGKNTYQGFKSSATFGISTKESTVADFVKALEQVTLRRQSDT
jgi:hypothetical protein